MEGAHVGGGNELVGAAREVQDGRFDGGDEEGAVPADAEDEVLEGKQRASEC